MVKKLKWISNAQKIREYVAKHKDAKPKDIAEALKLKTQYVYQVLHKTKSTGLPETPLKPFTQITPERMEELTYKITSGRDRRHPITGKRLMQGADIVAEHHTDMVNHPPHYKAGGIETIDFIEAKELGYHLGNVVKYVSRADHKGNKLEDLKKAQWYLARAIEKLG
jgi:hypothetical protein